MANKNFFEALTQYRLKVEKDGKPVVNVPTVFALPGLLVAPKLSIAGLVAALLLGLKVHLENEDGKTVNVEDAVKKAADAVRESVDTAAKTIKEEMDKAWETVSTDDPKEDAEETVEETAEKDAAESSEADDASLQDIVDELKAHEENDVPTIEVKPDESAQD